MLFQKWQEFGEFWPKHSKVSKIYTLIDSYCAKYLMFDLKNKIDAKFEEKLTCGLKNDTWGIWQFSPGHSKVSKLEFWWGTFVQSRKCMSFKFTEVLCVMTMKNDAKFEEELICHFKVDIRNLTNFDLSTWKFKKCALWLAPLTKVYNVWARKVQVSYVWWHWRLMQNLKENWPVLSKMTWGIWQICIGWNKWTAHLTKLFTHV